MSTPIIADGASVISIAYDPPQAVQVDGTPATRVTLVAVGPQGPPGASESFPGYGDYPAASVTNTLNAIIDRKAERTEIVVPDLVLWFENKLL